MWRVGSKEKALILSSYTKGGIDMTGLYPNNLVCEIFGEINGEYDYNVSGVEIALKTLSDIESKILLAKFKDGKTLEECGEIINKSRERARQIILYAVRKLRKPYCVHCIKTGIEPKEDVINEHTPIDALKLSVKSFNALLRNNIKTVGNLENITESELLKMRPIGMSTIKEVKIAMNTLNMNFKTD